MPAIDELKRAIRDSSALAQRGESAKALELLDHALENARKARRSTWVLTLGRHAAVIAENSGQVSRANSYYAECLAARPHDKPIRRAIAQVSRGAKRG